MAVLIMQSGVIVKTAAQHPAQALAYISKAISKLAQLMKDSALEVVITDINVSFSGHADGPDGEDGSTAPSPGAGLYQ